MSPWLAGCFTRGRERCLQSCTPRRGNTREQGKGLRGPASPVRSPGLMVWIGPRGFQKSSNHQSLLPRSLHNRGGTLPSSALWWIRVLELQGCELPPAPAAGLTGERVWHPRVRSQGCLSPSSLSLHHKPRALCLWQRRRTPCLPARCRAGPRAPRLSHGGPEQWH